MQNEALAFMKAAPLPEAALPSPDPLRGPPSPAEGGGKARGCYRHNHPPPHAFETPQVNGIGPFTMPETLFRHAW